MVYTSSMVHCKNKYKPLKFRFSGCHLSHHIILQLEIAQTKYDWVSSEKSYFTIYSEMCDIFCHKVTMFNLIFPIFTFAQARIITLESHTFGP